MPKKTPLRGAFLNLVARGDQTTDTRIFSRVMDRLRLYISKSYRGVRCPICTTMHNDAELVHAKFTQHLDSYGPRLFVVGFQITKFDRYNLSSSLPDMLVSGSSRLIGFLKPDQPLS